MRPGKRPFALFTTAPTMANMVWTLTRKELLSHLLTARLGLAVVFSLLLTAVATWIGSLDYADNHDAYELGLKDASEELGSATTPGGGV